MFNIGGGEFLVIALIALIVLGPQRLPDAARQVGKAMGELRRLSTGFQNELKDAFSEAETTGPSTPRRDVLATPRPDDHPTNGTSAPARSARTRRTPLQAAPVDAVTEPAADAPAPARPAKRAPRSTPISAPDGDGSAAPAPKGSRPRSRG